VLRANEKSPALAQLTPCEQEKKASSLQMLPWPLRIGPVLFARFSEGKPNACFQKSFGDYALF